MPKPFGRSSDIVTAMMDKAFTLLTTPPPEFSSAAAVKLLREEYGIAGSLKTLVSERDQNFLVELGSGDSCVLKITNSAEPAGVANFQTAALLHVAAKDPEFPVPGVRSTLSGRTETKITDADGREHTARVLSWLDGIPLRFAEPRPDNAEQLGQFLARLGNALADFEHPASDHVLLWDMLHAGHLVKLVDSIEDEVLRENCRVRLARFDDDIGAILEGLRSQVIYNDLNASNVLVNPDNPELLTGIIDFGDMVQSPLVIDVAVAAAYLCDEGEDPLASIVQFLRGYTRIRKLQADEIVLLYDLIITRNIMTIVITNWRAGQHPEHRDYILRNEPRARATINTFLDAGQEHVTNLFLDACQQ
jgi:hydroxylysine kinase